MVPAPPYWMEGAPVARTLFKDSVSKYNAILPPLPPPPCAKPLLPPLPPRAVILPAPEISAEVIQILPPDPPPPTSPKSPLKFPSALIRPSTCSEPVIVKCSAPPPLPPVAPLLSPPPPLPNRIGAKTSPYEFPPIPSLPLPPAPPYPPPPAPALPGLPLPGPISEPKPRPSALMLLVASIVTPPAIVPSKAVPVAGARNPPFLISNPPADIVGTMSDVPSMLNNSSHCSDLIVLPIPLRMMVGVEPAMLITTSSAAPGTEFVSQFCASFHNKLPPPPSQV